MRMGAKHRVICASLAALLLLASASLLSSAPRIGSAAVDGPLTTALHAVDATNAAATLASNVSRRWEVESGVGRRWQLVEPLAVLLGLVALALTRAAWSLSASDSPRVRLLTLRSVDPARAPPIPAR
jgi:hypothetical protein